MGVAADYVSRTRIGAYFHSARESRKLILVIVAIALLLDNMLLTTVGKYHFGTRQVVHRWQKNSLRSVPHLNNVTTFLINKLCRVHFGFALFVLKLFSFP